MQHLGLVPIPDYQASDSLSTIQSKCGEYAKAKAIDDFKTAGKISSLQSLQADIDTCMNSIDKSRQIRQGLVLAAGLGASAWLGFWLWKRM